MCIDLLDRLPKSWRGPEQGRAAFSNTGPLYGAKARQTPKTTYLRRDSWTPSPKGLVVETWPPLPTGQDPPHHCESAKKPSPYNLPLIVGRPTRQRPTAASHGRRATLLEPSQAGSQVFSPSRATPLSHGGPEQLRQLTSRENHPTPVFLTQPLVFVLHNPCASRPSSAVPPPASHLRPRPLRLLPLALPLPARTQEAARRFVCPESAMASLEQPAAVDASPPDEPQSDGSKLRTFLGILKK